jgi:hypothetical protein
MTLRSGHDLSRNPGTRVATEARGWRSTFRTNDLSQGARQRDDRPCGSTIVHQLDAKIEGFLTVMIRGSTSPTIKEVHE